MAMARVASIMACRPRRTQTINGYSANLFGQACQQQCHTGYIAVIFACLICGTKHYVFNAGLHPVADFAQPVF
jgi:hypothetical protein